MAVSRKILREHGGDILVQSQPGKRTQFVLKVPLKNALAPDMGRTSAEIPIVRPPDE